MLSSAAWPGKRSRRKSEAQCGPEQAPPVPAGGAGPGGSGCWNLPHSAFVGTRPILVRMFRRTKKAAVLAAQITSATQKAVLQL